jgi:hypothetical protein
LDVNEGAEYLDVFVIGVGYEFAIGFKHGLSVGVVAELGKPKSTAGLAKAIDALIVVYGTEVGSLSRCGVMDSVDDIS